MTNSAKTNLLVLETLIEYNKILNKETIFSLLNYKKS